MKRLLLLSALIIGCHVAPGQTIYVSGLQSGVWDADTVRVTGDVTVGESLSVHQGTVVLFDGFYSITVQENASFVAQGTESDSIVFTVADTTGIHIHNTGDGGWNGFQLNAAGHFLLDYCVLEYGKAADTLDRLGGALYINMCEDVNVRHTTFRCNYAREFGGAISATNSTVRFSDCKVNGNRLYSGDGFYYMYGAGAQFLKCDVEMVGMEFQGNYGATCIGGALSLDSCSVVLDRAVFVDNIGLCGAGLYIMRCNDKTCRFSNLLFDGNFAGHFAGGLAFLVASPEVYNILVTNNQSDGVNCNGVFFYQNCSPKLTNCIIYGNYPPPDSLHIDSIQMWLWTFEGYAPEFRNCLVEGDSKYVMGYDYIKVYENNIFSNPFFVDAENHDFHLTAGSPCIDAGDALTPQSILDGLDLDANPRMVNQRIDIGPFEYATTLVPLYASSSFATLIGNPLTAHSRIEFDRAVGEVVVSVYSMNGRCAVRKELDLGGSKSLGIGSLVNDLALGVYLIEVKDKDELCVMKAVK